MKHLKLIIEYIRIEFTLILKDRSLISILLISPLFYSLFYSSIYIKKTSYDLPIGIIDNQKSPESRKLVFDLDLSSKIKVKKEYQGFDEAIRSIKLQDIYAVIVIPETFNKNIYTEKTISVQLFVNNTRFLISNEISKAINEVIFNYNTNQIKKYFNKLGYNNTVANYLSEPVCLDIRNLFNTTESYGDFLIPAILMLILNQTLLMAASASFAISFHAKWESISKRENFFFIISKLFVYLLFYLSYTIFINTVILDLFHIPLRGPMFGLVTIAISSIVPTFLLGVLLSTFIKDRLNLFRVITLTSYPIFILSGYSWPKIAIPDIVNYLTLLLPYTSYSDSFLILMINGGSVQGVMPQLFVLITITILYAFLLYLRLNILTKKQKGV